MTCGNYARFSEFVKESVERAGYDAALRLPQTSVSAPAEEGEEA